MSREGTARSDYFFRAVELFLLSVFRVTGFLFRIFPPRVMDGIFTTLGCIVFYARPGMKRRLLAKISDALPEIRDRRELERIGREACGSFLRPIYDLHLFARYEDRLMRELKVEGMENLEMAESCGKGVILLGSHLGAASLRLAVMMRLGKPYTPVIFNPESSPVAGYVKIMTEYGRTLGYDPLDNPVIFAGEDAVSSIGERLSSGGKVAINFDVDGGFIVDFLGKPAAMASGAAHFALNTGASIVPFSLQRGDGVFGHHMKIYEPLEYTLSGDRKTDLNSIMTRVVEAGERVIRDTPGQWMSWFGLWQWWDKAARKAGQQTIPYSRFSI